MQSTWDGQPLRSRQKGRYSNGFSSYNTADQSYEKKNGYGHSDLSSGKSLFASNGAAIARNHQSDYSELPNLKVPQVKSLRSCCFLFILNTTQFDVTDSTR